MIKVESRSEDLSNYTSQDTPPNNNNTDCKDWYLRAVQTASMFFGTLRMEMSMPLSKTCNAVALSECPAKPFAGVLQGIMTSMPVQGS